MDELQRKVSGWLGFRVFVHTSSRFLGSLFLQPGAVSENKLFPAALTSKEKDGTKNAILLPEMVYRAVRMSHHP